MLLSIELSIIAIIFISLVFSLIFNDVNNYIYCLLILTIAATETVIGLSLLINFINLKQDIQITSI